MKLLAILLTITLCLTFIVFSFSSIERKQSDYSIGYDYYKHITKDDIKDDVYYYGKDKMIVIFKLYGVRMGIVTYYKDLHIYAHSGDSYMFTFPSTMADVDEATFINNIDLSKCMNICTYYKYEYITKPPNAPDDTVTDYYYLSALDIEYNAMYFLQVFNNISYSFDYGTKDFVLFDDIVNNVVTWSLDYVLELLKAIMNVYSSLGGVFN